MVTLRGNDWHAHSIHAHFIGFKLATITQNVYAIYTSVPLVYSQFLKETSS